jgi:hypothetical protein
MFHTRKATVLVDKVYALLGMSSDDPSTAGLSADYGASWETVFRRLVTFSLSDQMSVETWDEKEVAVISGKGCVLGEVSVVKGDTVTWKDRFKGRSQCFTLPASVKPIRPRDVICLLQGASRPTIIRLYSDYSAVIRIAVSFVDDSDVSNTKWSTTTFPDDFLLIWDWDISWDQEHAKEYEDFRSGQGLSHQKPQPQEDLDRATRLWRMGRVLECVGRDEEAADNFQKSVEMGMMVLRGADSSESSHAGWAAWGDLLVEDRGGWTSLSYAARKGYEAFVRQLLDNGAMVDTKDNKGKTPLSWAAAHGHEAVVKLLLGTGKVDVDTKDKFGQTPLFWAAARGHEAVVKLLRSIK